MKSPLVIFLLLLGTVGLTAQSATIVDADGWTNVREKPSKDSEVVTRGAHRPFGYLEGNQNDLC